MQVVQIFLMGVLSLGIQIQLLQIYWLIIYRKNCRCVFTTLTECIMRKKMHKLMTILNLFEENVISSFSGNF